MSELNDFGFSFIDEDDIVQAANNVIAYEMVETLINNLLSNESDVIKWPYQLRKASCENFLSDLKVTLQI